MTIEEAQKHVDDFIEFGTDNEEEHEKYARWVLNYFRLSATCKLAFHEFMKDHKLFCNYKGKKYRVTGASRLGDVWLTEDLNKEHGYDHRVLIIDCSNWSRE